MAASPSQKLKFSRKFVIDLKDAPENPVVNLLEQRLLRYKRRYYAKKAKIAEEVKKNKEFKQELDFEQDQIRSLTKELEKEFCVNEKLVNENGGIEKSVQQATDILNSETFNVHLRSLESSEGRCSMSVAQLEELQELLFISSKKATDLERFVFREQKKNESLAKELKMLKIDLSSKQSKLT